MTDYSSTAANLPSAAIRNPGWSEAYDDATNRDSATPTEYAGAHVNAIHNEVEAIEKWLFRVATELTIDGAGAITVTHGHHTVDTAGDAGTDNLDTLDGGAAGKRVRLRAVHADRTVVIRDGQDNILCGGSNITLDDTNKWVEFEYDVPLTAWLVVGGGGNGAAQTPWLSTIDADDNALEDLGRLNYTAASEVTISSGAVTVTETVHTVDTAGDAAIDDLDTINGGTDGDVLILLPEDAARTVWITVAGNIETLDGRHYPIPAVGAKLYYDGSNWLLRSCGNWGLVEDHTVALTAGMSAATVQALIDSMPRYYGPYDLTFQAADGAYTFNAELAFDGFYGGMGGVFLRGNMGESGLHTNQAVDFDFSATDCNGIVFTRCTRGQVWNVKAQVDTTTSVRNGILMSGMLLPYVNGCYVVGTGTTKGTGIQVAYGSGFVQGCYVSNVQYGVKAFNARLISNNNDDTGTQPAYGLRAEANGSIGKGGANQPAGSTGNESTSGGGVIR